MRECHPIGGILWRPDLLYSSTTKIGQSFGPADGSSNGTLGPYVKAIGGPYDGNIYAITCDHVVFVDHENSEGMEYIH
jgi:hypothetical protein